MTENYDPYLGIPFSEIGIPLSEKETNPINIGELLKLNNISVINDIYVSHSIREHTERLITYEYNYVELHIYMTNKEMKDSIFEYIKFRKLKNENKDMFKKIGLFI